MPINPQLLVAAPMLQDYLVNKDDGQAMSAGIITMYRDNARTILKNWFYQSGVPGAYTYVPLDNPLTLSSVGTITDPNGVDTIPFYYPFDENDDTVFQPYYVTVDNSNLERQFTRENFPFEPQEAPAPPEEGTPTLRNLIVNNVFWRNIGSLNVASVTQAVIAPSQHDGYLQTMTDMQFIKNATGATETLSFNTFVPPANPPGSQTFPDQIFGGDDVTPEFYINLNCTGAGSETSKYIQIPLQLHVKSLSGYAKGIFVLEAMNVAGNVNNQITISLLQFLGTGVASPIPTIVQTLTLSSTWTKYIVEMPLPSAQNLVLGSGGDDAFFIQIGFPTAKISNINIAKPSFYLTNEAPTDDFDTYEYSNAFITANRTGDVRVSINQFYYFGWVPMNNGTIGNATSNATSRANSDTWPLYSLLWNYAKPYDSGSTFNPICQLFDSSGVAINFGTNAIDDFNANDQLQLTSMFGEVVMGTVPIAALTTNFKQAVTFTNSAGKLLATVTSGAFFFNGQAITFAPGMAGVLPTGLVTNAVYYVSGVSGNTFKISTTYANSLIGTVISFTNTGTPPNNVFCNLAGAEIGEYAHVQSGLELAAHSHPPPLGGATSYQVQGGAGTGFGGAGAAQAPTVTGISGSSAPANVVQPSAFYNIYMKL